MLHQPCRRLIAASCLPDRAGQPTQIQLHMSLDQLRGLDGAAGAAAGWAGRWPAAGPGAECDATIVPVVSGNLDRSVLDELAAALLRRDAGASRSAGAGRYRDAARDGDAGQNEDAGRNGGAGHEGGAAGARRLRAERAARRIIVARAADLLSGPGGLASFLRTGLPDDLVASVSLPLDIGAATDTIPVHLRRAVTIRDRHCRFARTRCEAH